MRHAGSRPATGARQRTLREGAGRSRLLDDPAVWDALRRRLELRMTRFEEARRPN